MVTFIGANDRETLEGAIEAIDRELRSERIKATRAKLSRDRYAALYAVAKLSGLRDYFEEASKNGPTPTPAQIAALRVTIPDDSRRQLLKEKLHQLCMDAGVTVWLENDNAGGAEPDAFKFKINTGTWSRPYDTEAAMLEQAIDDLTPPDPMEDGDVYRDGGWEDRDGFPVPTTTAPDCDRTCLSCQGGDHGACGMGCHIEGF
jgi:hypothetical protein